MKVKIFRWKAIGPLLLLFALIGVLVWIFAEPVARQTTEEASTELLGTQVDVGKLDLLPRQASVDISALQIADPFAPSRNLVEAEQIRLKLNPAALAEKKLVVERFNLTGMRFGTERKTPARPVSGKGFAPQLLRSVQQWTKQFNVPLLSLTPVDTIRQLVLNPGQLTTLREAQTLVARTDSTRKALVQNFQQLGIEQTVDSARALADRLSHADIKALGLTGTRDAVQSVQQTLREIDAAKKRVQALEQSTESGVQLLTRGVSTLEEARQKDFAFAKSLLKLPTFSAPDIGSALFGKVSIERFQQAVYWAELAQHYMPPGLLPRQTSGPKRLRASGSTIQFPKAQEYPNFLLQEGQIDFSIGGSSLARGAYAATVQGLTTEPSLYGRPMVLSARRRAANSALASIDVDAVINHVTRPIRDSVSARLRGVRLPSFKLPGIPFQVAPGTGASMLNFALKGDQLFGRWAIGSNQVRWTPDTTGRSPNDLERLVWQVISGLNALDVTAEIRGSLASPKLSVASNLDQAISKRLQAVIGAEVKKAEQKVRAKVDSLVADKVEPAKRQVASVQAEATQRVQAQQQRLNEVQRRLQAELDRLTRGLVPGVELPKIKL
jgi:uncharacterized protein (TIGR03545 family)